MPTPYYCEGHFVGGGQFCSYCGITDTQAQEKEIENTFIGDDAMREYWTIKFNNLQEQDRKLILSAFPDIESKDKITLKDPQELYAIAFRKVLRRFAVVCPRCGGCGNYSTAVAYTRVDDGICHKCNGRVMPCDVPAVGYQENYKGTDTVVTDDGRVLRVMVFKNPSPSGLQPIIDGKGYISHFATCPYANKYRRCDND